MTELPPRYEPIGALGRGGGGEVWSVRDTLTGQTLALKLLAPDAGEQEVAALVREASALSGLEGLGVPVVVAFGRLHDGARCFLVRELVEGRSLEELLDDPAGPSWAPPLVRAAEQLTVLHRAGLFHGDVKPANVIVSPAGEGTLVDLGLAAPWREGGARARGFTPRFAAPELLRGEPLTVRAEVFSLGATVQLALERRPEVFGAEARERVRAVAELALRPSPRERPPSVDEVASVLAEAAGLSFRPFDAGLAWPVLGVDAVARELLDRTVGLPPAGRLVLVGPPGAGTSTLLRRLAWSLGVAGERVVDLAGSAPDAAVAHLLHATLAAWSRGGGSPDRVIVLADPGALGPLGRAALREALASGAKIASAGPPAALADLGGAAPGTFDVAPLDRAVSRELLRRAVPSLPDALVEHVAERLRDRPGALRAFVRTLGARPVVSRADVDELLDERGVARGASAPPSSTTAHERRAALERALATGRFEAARELLAALGEVPPELAGVVALARARVALARGEIGEAGRALDAAKGLEGTEARVHAMLAARVSLRSGAYAEAVTRARVATEGQGGSPAEEAVRAEALAVTGVAQAYLGDDGTAMATLARAEGLAEPLRERRAAAVVHGSLAIVHQRAARKAEARAAYLRAAAEAESANDAWTLATTRLNLAGLAQTEGEVAEALGHLEAAVDLGRRAGVPLAVLQATLNLANLDLWLGRFARARAAITDLSSRRTELQPTARAQLLGLEAELVARTGDPARAAELYERSAEAWDAVGRPLDAAEARLEGLLAETAALRETRRAEGGPSPAELAQLDARLDRLRASLGEGGFGEHLPLARLVEGELALAAGDESRTKAALDEAVERASATQRREWTWRAREARARLFAAQGAFQLARRDSEQALEVLEGIAATLPRDLREVFWNDPRRRALRVSLGRSTSVHEPSAPAAAGAGEATMLATASFALSGSSFGTSHGGSTVSTLGTPLPQEDRLARIFAITRDLARDHDLERVLERVTDHAVQLVSAERGLVVLLDQTGEPRVHVARDGRGDASVEAFSRSVAERVIDSGEPVVATSAQDDAGLAQAASVHRHLIQSIACVPIRGPSGRTLGALYLETRRRPGHRFRTELPTLGAFADQAAIAIESARLIDENRRRAEDLARANEELERAKDKLAEALGRRTEQLETARRDLKAVRAELRSHFGYQGLVGTSAPMRKLYALVDRVKDTEVPVLIRGESGTGKEVVAKAIHQAGARGKGGPFLGVNCGAIPANLLESELFGHVKGAFTGADRDRKGLFREAEKGTILLDEVGEMPLKMQAGLLRVLQEKTVRPVGGTREEACDARVIAATNRDLATMVREGTFREDLFYRLHVVEVLVPPLRERREDLPALVDHFLGIFSARHRREKKTFDREAMRLLTEHPWPGNVRQLEHVLLNAWIMSDGDEIGPDDITLPSDTTSAHASGGSRGSSISGHAAGGISEVVPRARNKDEYRDVEKDRILAALDATSWNRVKAAEKLGMPRRTFYRRLKEYGIL